MTVRIDEVMNNNQAVLTKTNNKTNFYLTMKAY